jgi:hypothetical protein
MVICILIGLIIWLVLPMCWNKHVKKKKDKEIVNKLCFLLGIFIIVLSVVKYIVNLLS